MTNDERKGRGKLCPELARHIRRLREQLGLTHQELADQFGVTRRNIGHVLANKVYRDDQTERASLNYQEFLDTKSQLGTDDGFAPTDLPSFLFDFQSALVDWAVRKGRAAIFADCGLGKTPMQLAWADQVRRHTNKPVLLITPLAVTAQTIAEGEKFGIQCQRSDRGQPRGHVTITNYERLHHFNPSDFAGAACDESSILKNYDGERRQMVTEFMKKLPYRLLCTATAAPNDYIELGTSSEALGNLGHVDMLGRFFKNDMNNIGQGRSWGGAAKWRFKGHAQEPFWRWVCSWGRALRRPSDLGPYDDSRFVLPPLVECEHIIDARELAEGQLFALPAVGMREERDEMRRSIQERCERVAQLVDHKRPAVSWCHLNPEGDLLARLIPDAIQVSGSDSLEAKEEKLIAFAAGQVRVLVIKPKIGALGLNWQHCAHMTVFPSHSFEQYYQAVRRCWRFGQTQPVVVDVVTTHGGHGVMANLQRKSRQADDMFARLVAYMNDPMALARASTFATQPHLPAWLSPTS